MTNAKPPEQRLYDYLSRRARLLLFAAILCMFSPLAMLTVSGVAQGWALKDLAAWMIGSALIAGLWAFAGLRGRQWWLPIPFNIVIPTILQRYFSGSIALPGMGPTVAGLATVILVVAGYILFIIFINGEGRRTIYLQTEINLAREIHDHLVPDVTFANEHYEILGTSSPSSEVGGDLLDVHVDDNQARIVVADVSGHGVRAGVLMAMMKSAIHMKLLQGEGNRSLFADLNDVIFDLKRPDMYATGILLQSNGPGTFRYTNAGHPSVLHYNLRTKRMARHESQHPPLGVMRGTNFPENQILVEPGDLLAILTDGLTEVLDRCGEEYGLERIEQVIRELETAPLDKLQSTLLGRIREFGAQTDDQTLVLVRVK